MKTIQTEILVIGGGATGTGVVRDLAMRGFDTVLVEKRDFTHGTTGRFHGLLHSGGRYVVKDPHAARECIEENRILRFIMPQCIEDTGGYFVVTPHDDPDYARQFVDGCHQAGIPIENVSISKMVSKERFLNPGITHCFRVPDASADSFLAAHLNAASAEEYGAKILNYHQVINLLNGNQQIVGALCQDISTGNQVRIQADLIVNASGAWAGHIAEMAGIDVKMIPGKGTMIAVNHRIVNTVINRCKMPSDGDILVPAHTVAVIGTTDVPVKDPDQYAVETWEIDKLLTEGEKLIPGFKDMRMLRAWAGVRPLYEEKTASDNRDITRAYTLLDHTYRDGIDGFVTITSGKWTTYRKMAQDTVDLICRKLKTKRECRTHLEPLSPGATQKTNYLGTRLSEIEEQKIQHQLICECELATYQQVEEAISDGRAKTIDDIRRDIRLGMGPCQGGFCSLRATGLLHEIKQTEVTISNTALYDFLEERWKGLLPILWGQQLRQERLNEFVYLNLLNVDHLPHVDHSPFSPTPYSVPDNKPPVKSSIEPKPGISNIHQRTSSGLPVDVLVIGAGLAGLVSAWQVAKQGNTVRVISKGKGKLLWSSGCIDVLGYSSKDKDQLVLSPAEEIETLIDWNPKHPYSKTTPEIIEHALDDFLELFKAYNYPFHGSLHKNWLLPTSVGAVRPTCLAPETMISGGLNDKSPMLIVGFTGYHDFSPQFIADNLQAQGTTAYGLTIDLSSVGISKGISTLSLAHQFDNPEFYEAFGQFLKAQLSRSEGRFERIGLPAVLGINSALTVKNHLENLLSVPIFEIPTLPPSIPGLRIQEILVKAIETLDGQVYYGMEVKGSDHKDHNVERVWSEAAARKKPHHARHYILATGGVLGGGFFADYSGVGSGTLRETIFDLPINASKSRLEWCNNKFISNKAHSVFTTGIDSDDRFKPLDPDGEIIYNNLQCVGSLISGSDYLRERSLEGIAIFSAHQVAEMISLSNDDLEKNQND